MVHKKNLDANYDLGSWYIDHIDCFQNKDIAIFASFSALLSYRYEGSFSPEAKAIRTKADKKLRKCLRVLLHEIDCSAITKIKYYAFSLSHTLYRIILHITDPSVKHYEKILKQRYTHSEQ